MWTLCVCHATWLKNLLKELNFSQRELIEIYVHNKSPIFIFKESSHQSKHIDTKREIFLLWKGVLPIGTPVGATSYGPLWEQFDFDKNKKVRKEINIYA